MLASLIQVQRTETELFLSLASQYYFMIAWYLANMFSIMFVVAEEDGDDKVDTVCDPTALGWWW